MWDYLDGADGLSTLSTGLYSSTAAEETPAELMPLALDEHEGFTGGGDTRSVYTLTLKSTTRSGATSWWAWSATCASSTPLARCSLA